MIHLVGVFFGHIVGFFFALIAVIFGDAFCIFFIVELFDGVAANVSDTDLGPLAKLFDLIDDLLSAFLAQRRDIQANHFAFDNRRQAQFAGADGLFDVFDTADVASCRSGVGVP
jgi:hypothetical protein